MPRFIGPTTINQQFQAHCPITTSRITRSSHILDICNIPTDNSEYPIQNSLADDDENLCCICQPLCYLPKKRRPVCGKNCLLIDCFSKSCNFVCPQIACDCCWNRWHRHRLPNENLLVLSVIQLLCGFASIILFSVALTKSVFLYRMATGMWAGFLMLIAGVQGLITARRPILCTIIGLLVICVLSTLCACLLIGVSVAGTIEDGFVNHAVTRSKSSGIHSLKFTQTFHENDNLIPGSGITHLDQSGLWKSMNWTGFGPFRLRTFNNDLMAHILDPHLRTCQVILHVLLLLVGILDSSISLSIAVLCCRYVCQHPTSSWSGRNSQSNRTNIVSFDTATANQAAALFRSGDVSQFVGSGNLLLAVATDSMVEHESLLRRPVNNEPLTEPYLHHTVTPFLPESNRSALILTQAGTGSMAWTAARAAATLLDHNRPEISPQFTEHVHRQSVPNVTHKSLSKRLWSRFPKRSKRPRLLFTSLDTPSTRATVVSHNSDLPASNHAAPPYRPASTLLYVMPSPIRDEAPMIFPPFPPTYSPLQRRPSMVVPSRTSDSRLSRSRLAQSGVQHCRGRRNVRRPGASNVNIFSRIFSPHESRWRVWSSRPQTNHPTSRQSHPRASASALMCAVDRLLQPVLIVEGSDVVPHALPEDAPPDPPKYSILEYNQDTMNDGTE